MCDCVCVLKKLCVCDPQLQNWQLSDPHSEDSSQHPPAFPPMKKMRKHDEIKFSVFGRESVGRQERYSLHAIFIRVIIIKINIIIQITTIITITNIIKITIIIITKFLSVVPANAGVLND